ncbi:hypothetical protein MPLB_2040029 [Mesorhizobium sp. ORS 3324]|nr:hypothetical protein MPLB_2040029 [Mesorhizobium sp. ORS 3324]
MPREGSLSAFPNLTLLPHAGRRGERGAILWLKAVSATSRRFWSESAKQSKLLPDKLPGGSVPHELLRKNMNLSVALVNGSQMPGFEHLARLRRGG